MLNFFLITFVSSFVAVDDEPHVPDVCSLLEAIQLFLQHPVLQMLVTQLQEIHSSNDNSNTSANNNATFTMDDITQAVHPYMTKAEAGRYRSAQQLIRDLWYIVEGKLQPLLHKALSHYTVHHIAQMKQLEQAEEETDEEKNKKTVMKQQREEQKERIKYWKDREVFLIGCLKAFLEDDLEECVRL